MGPQTRHQPRPPSLCEGAEAAAGDGASLRSDVPGGEGGSEGGGGDSEAAVIGALASTLLAVATTGSRRAGRLVWKVVPVVTPWGTVTL